MLVDLIEPFQGQMAAGLAIRAGVGWGDASALELTKGLGLADGFPAGSPRLCDLPEKRPKDQAQIPTTVAGMGTFVFLGQEVGWEEGFEEQFELMKG
jgi:hypothetical protein